MHKNIKRETFYLYAVQVSNIVLPLIMVPYLAHVLGVASFGKISFAQAISYICIFLVDFGFNFSAARGIGLNPENKKVINCLYSNVQCVKFLIFSIVILIAYFCSIFLSLSIIDSQLLLLGALSSFCSIVMPVWLFQGLGKNSYVALLNFITRIVSLGLILLFVRTPEDVLIAAALQLFSPLIAGLVMQGIIIKKKIVELKREEISVLQATLITKESYHNFSASFLTLGFTYFNPLIVKFFLGDVALGLYSFADKLANVLRQLYLPLVQATFSNICGLFQKEKYVELRKLLLTVFIFFTGVTVTAYLGNVFLGDLIIGRFFSQAHAISNLLLVMIITQGIISYSMILVNLIIIPAGLSYYLKIVYLKALFFYAIVVYPLIHFFGINGVAGSIALVELLIIGSFWFFIKKKKILWAAT
ncbi:oligosaccharide flippase family protein [Enterobacter ludwigii]